MLQVQLVMVVKLFFPSLLLLSMPLLVEEEVLLMMELEVLVGEIYQTKMVPQTKVVAAEEEILFLARNQPEMSVALVDLV